MSAESTCPQCGTPQPDPAEGGACRVCVAKLVAERAGTPADPGISGLRRAIFHGNETSKTKAVEFSPGEFDAGPGTANAPNRFGDYEIMSELAQGGMGVVYKARQISLNRIVAIKMVRTGRYATEQEVRRFRTEAEAVAHLQHPNIVAIHEVGEAGGQPFFSMDYIEGQNLAEVVRQSPLPPREAATQVRVIAGAIHHAHQRGILHRDLKPSNVLIDSSGQPRVTDFGLAKLMAGDSELTLSGTIMGSPSYMSPEQASGHNEAVTVRSDVYSLGAILYELVSGRPPFAAESAVETMRQVVEENPIPPRQINSRIPADLETICLKCLEKLPDRRYENADDLAQDLGRFLRDEPIAARPVGPGERFWRWCRRNPHLSGAVGTAVLLFIAGFAMTLWQWWRAEKTALTARQNYYAVDMNLAGRAIGEHNYTNALKILLAHRPQARESDLRGWEWRYLWSLCRGTELFTLRGHTGIVTAVALSPDGRWLASAGQDRRIHLWNFENRERAAILPGRTYGVSQTPFGFSADSQRLVVAEGDRVSLYQTADWSQVWTRRFPGALGIAFSPDGQRVAACSARAISIWETTGGKPVTTLSTDAAIESADPNKRATIGRGQIAFSPDGRFLYAPGAEQVMAWDTVNRDAVQPVGPLLPQLSALSVSSNGVLAMGTRDGRAHLWDLKSGRSLGDWKASASSIFTMAFSPDAETLAIGGSEHVIQLWTVTNQHQLTTLKGHLGEIWSLTFSKDGRRLVSGGKDFTVKVWDPSARPEARTLPGSFWPLHFSPDSKHVVTFNTNRDLNLTYWDVVTKRPLRVVPAPVPGKVDFQQISPNGKFMAYRTFDRIIHLRNLESNSDAGVIPLDQSSLAGVRMFTFSPDNKLLAVAVIQQGGGARSATEIFRLADNARIAVFEDTQGPIQFSEDGRLLAGQGSNASVRVWNVFQRRLLQTLRGQQSDVKSVVFSPDGKRLAVGSTDTFIRVWDLATSKEIQTLAGHREGVGHLVFSKDGLTLFSCSTDNTVKLWHVATGREMISLNDFGEDTWMIKISPDGRTIAVGGISVSDAVPGPVKLWRAPPWEEIHDAAAGLRAAK